MKKEYISTDKATPAGGPYTQAVKAGNTVYFAGVCGDDPVTEEIMGNGDMSIEAKYAMENLKNTVEAVGCTMDDIVKVTVLVTDIKKLPEFNKVYASYFNGHFPARMASQVVALAGTAQLELDAIAVCK